jgi:hypothetical protein
MKEAIQATKDKAQKWKKDKLKKLNPLQLQQEQQQKQLPVPPRIKILMMTSLRSMIS